MINSRILGLALVIAVGAPGCYWAARIAWADWLSTQDSVPQRIQATALVPSNAILWVRLAQKQQELGISAIPSYTHAVQCEPLNAKLWIGLGLEQEIGGDYQSAEKHFLHAASLSREFIPVVTLAGFYFRRNAQAPFTVWARKALEITSLDRGSIFKMAWDLAGSEPPDDFLPKRREVLRDYLDWLLNSNSLIVPKRQAYQLVKDASPAEVPVLLTFCSRSLNMGDFPAAAGIWNTLVAKRLIEGAAIPSPDGLQNTAFERDPLKGGFDWVVTPQPGIVPVRSSQGLTLYFSGYQPENCDLLGQYVMVQSGQRYKIDFEYETSGVPVASGLTWDVIANHTTRVASSPALYSEKPAWAAFTFTAPSNVGGVRLQLNYQRSLGTRRTEGWLRLRRITLRTTG